MMLMIILLLVVIMQILVIHRIAWRRLLGNAFCDASTVLSGSVIGPSSGGISCDVGCSPFISGSPQFRCTDFSVNEDWSAGELTNELNLTGVTNFELV